MSTNKKALILLLLGAALLLSRKASWEQEHCKHGEVAVDTDGIAGPDDCMLR